MSLPVLYTPGATRQLHSIESYIARRKSKAVAAAYVEKIRTRCDRLALAPFQGTSREGLKPGLRTTGFKNRVTNAFVVKPKYIAVVSIAYAGRRYQSHLES